MHQDRNTIAGLEREYHVKGHVVNAGRLQRAMDLSA